MPQYIAFLRGIHGEKMEPLRRTLEEMGFINVHSFLASGNLIFETPSHDSVALERQLEKELSRTLGYELAVFVRLAGEVAEIAHYNSFDDTDPQAKDNTLYIGFLKAQPNENSQRKLLTYSTENDVLHVDGREVYWLCRTTESDSKLSGTVVERTLDMQATMRNIRTVRRIVAKFI